MKLKSHYPSFDVMKEKDHWDEHTQKIVTSRLHAPKTQQFLTTQEVTLLRVISSLLTGDDRENLIDYVIHHIDQTLSSTIGEGQRKEGVPKAQDLIRLGLKCIDESTQETYGAPFIELSKEKQQHFLTLLSQSQAFTPKWDLVPQIELFKKLLKLTLEAYYSHPVVWSEMGYAGPAYPRGYVRTHLGQLDPWEAQPEYE